MHASMSRTEPTAYMYATYVVYLTLMLVECPHGLCPADRSAVCVYMEPLPGT